MLTVRVTSPHLLLTARKLQRISVPRYREPTMPMLQIELLGDFHLRFDGEPVTSLYQARQQSLLAYLLLHRQAPQPRQHMAFCLWPDSTEAQAKTNLRRELHHLRRLLPHADQFLAVD